MSIINEGSPCPAFSTVDQDGNPVTSEQLIKDKKTFILYFYPKDDTPGCTIEAQEFRDYIGEFDKKNARIFGVSKDDCGSHKAFIEKFKLNFPLLADIDGSLYNAFGIKARSTVIVKDGVVSVVIPKVTPKGHATEILSKLFIYQVVPNKSITLIVLSE